MNLWFVDDTEENVDIEFDAALFVVASDAITAGKMWEAYYERGAKVARCTLVLTNIPDLPQGVIEWDKFTQAIVQL